MATYLVDSSHTKEECLSMLDEIEARGKDFLAKFEFGCNSGVHEAWAFIEGQSDADVRDMLPATARSRARIVKVERFTPSQIKSLHRMT